MYTRNRRALKRALRARLRQGARTESRGWLHLAFIVFAPLFSVPLQNVFSNYGREAVWVAASAEIPLLTSTLISTRRFCARPVLVSLLATGFVEP